MLKQTKRMIQDFLVTVLVFVFLGLLVWFIYSYQHHKLIFQGIGT